ncbi:Pseudouridine-5'-phosphate glycosidase [Frankia canadensis]|uniref:Pseudouridine-5'-phosphate glycosidase n=1 Tax=Frankia canadensis TaxID=1836972 RepID=A0A2I2KX29_9ACTN|nr:pseudouridine-5'-phosphate glycosidase [Frankia canadensis]SNQ50225.1 Pseudouridine-5'-phosphate glycosidase [Frankia canadensis]SOU57515.1 Pseudouridine-5'-phosphate glycosidase [Frankia canadensis]
MAGRSNIVVSAAVREALAVGAPVVALESTLIAHGLPRPRNRDVALELEDQLREKGVTPATVAVIDGLPRVGLDEADLRRIADDTAVLKVSVRDLPVACATGRTGATTVASTALLAARAGIRVFATGGLGGVHRGAGDSFDESADLVALATTPITVVCAGVKSILDVGATLERLETLGVTVLGYRTSTFPGFYLQHTSYDLDWRVGEPGQVATVMAAADAMELASAIVVANPLPTDQALDPALHDRVLTDALTWAADRGIRGKSVTPFLLETFHLETGGASLEVNINAVRNNVSVAADVAVAWARTAASDPGQPG